MNTSNTNNTNIDASTFCQNWKRMVAEIQKVVVGCDEALRLAGIAMFSDGHLLLQSVPGLGKTTMAFSIGHTIKDGVAGWFAGTADLLPMDIIGSKAWNPATRTLEIQHGAIKPEFNVVLADEINRMTPKAGSSLLGVMEERVLNVQGEVFHMADPFLVIGTMNPIEQEGTYPPPEAALDRFAVMGALDYPSRELEIQLACRKSIFARNQQEAAGMEKVITPAELLAMRRFAQDEVTISESVTGYIVDLVRATRPKNEECRQYLSAELHKLIAVGASSRGVKWLTACSRAAAALRGSKVVCVSDVKSIAKATLAHRLVLNPMVGFRNDKDELLNEIFARLVEKVPAVKE